MQLLYTFELYVAAGVAAGLHHIPIGIPVSKRIGAAHHTTVVPLNSIEDDDCDCDDTDDGYWIDLQQKQHCHQYNVEDEREDEEAH